MKKFMSLNEIIANMGEGNSKALEILTALAKKDAFEAAENDNFGLEYLKTINNYEIYGNNLQKFFEICCSDDFMIFEETLIILSANVLPENLVHKAIDQGVSIVSLETIEKYLEPIMIEMASEENLFKTIKDEKFDKDITNELEGRLQEKEAPIKNYVKPARRQTLDDVTKKYQSYAEAQGYNKDIISVQVDTIINAFDLTSKKFVKLFEESCDGSCHKLDITLKHFLANMFRPSQIDKNLNLTHPVPFVDKRVFSNYTHLTSLDDEYVLSEAELYKLLESDEYKNDLIDAFERNYENSLIAFGNGESQPD